MRPVTYPSGLRVEYERPLAYPDRLARVEAVEGATRTLLADGFVYSPAGRLLGYTLGNGLAYEITRGPGSRVERIQVPGVLDLAYGYDAVGNILSIEDDLDVGRSATYTYDDMDRLHTATGPTGDQVYDYDAAGNRTAHTLDYFGPLVLTYHYAPGTSRLLSVREPGGTDMITLTYDAAGAATTYRQYGLGYDAAGRMVTMTLAADGTVVMDNAYDARSRLVRSESRRFVYDAADRLLAEYEAVDPATEYVYLDDYFVLAARQNGAWHWYVNDHLPTPRRVLDDAGEVAWDADLDPFGQMTVSVRRVTSLTGRTGTATAWFDGDRMARG